jgi:hypothetical protein
LPRLTSGAAIAALFRFLRSPEPLIPIARGVPERVILPDSVKLFLLRYQVFLLDN